MSKGSWFEKLQIALVGTVLFVVCVTSINSTFEGYYSFYYEQGNYTEFFLSKITRRISASLPFRFFTSYTGFNTGYGFFAPNVSSDFLFVFKFYNRAGDLDKIIDHVPFRTKEASLRFRSISNMYLAKLKDSSHTNYDERYAKYLDIILKQISKYVKQSVALDAPKMETSLYLFDYPSIEAFGRGKKEKLYLVKRL